MEELRTDVLSRQCRVQMSDVEGMALVLSHVTKALGELKGKYHFEVHVHTYYYGIALMPQLDVRLTGDQEVMCLVRAGSGNILSWRLIMKYFLLSVSPFH